MNSHKMSNKLKKSLFFKLYDYGDPIDLIAYQLSLDHERESWVEGKRLPEAEFNRRYGVGRVGFLWDRSFLEEPYHHKETAA